MTVDPFQIRHPGGVQLQRDVTPADWIASRLMPWGRDAGTRVCSIVPTDYRRYLRVFHHAEEQVGDGWKRCRWDEVANRTGHVMHPTAQFSRFRWPHSPPERQLDRIEASCLIDVLRGQTTTHADCWFAIWHGYGELSGAVGFLHLRRRGLRGWLARRKQQRQRLEAPPGLADAPTVTLPSREYYLYGGGIDTVPHFEFMTGSVQTPNMWWPQDRSWFVGTEVDFDSTLVACGDPCAESLLASDLEVLEVAPEDRIDIAGDRINPADEEST